MARLRPWFVALLLAPSLLACSKDPKKQLQGKWVGESVENFSGPQAERAEGWATGASFEFKGSRVTVTIPAESPREGGFEVTSATNGAMKLAFVREDGSKDSADFAVGEDGRLRWQLGDGRRVVLRKARD